MFFAHEFKATITNTIEGQSVGTCLVLPGDIEVRLPFDRFPKLRVDAEIDGMEHQGAFVPFAGRRKMMVSQRLLKRLGKSVGDVVKVGINVADQDALFLPRELDDALEDEALRDAWGEMPLGRRRSWCFRIDKLKSREARLRNIDKLMAELLG